MIDDQTQVYPLNQSQADLIWLDNPFKIKLPISFLHDLGILNRYFPNLKINYKLKWKMWTKLNCYAHSLLILIMKSKKCWEKNFSFGLRLTKRNSSVRKYLANLWVLVCNCKRVLGFEIIFCKLVYIIQ